jgi:PAS domain S-box-containing protein
VLLLAVAYCAYRAGLITGLISAAIQVMFSAIFFSKTGHLFHYDTNNLLRTVVISLVSPAMAVMIGMLRQEADELVDRLKTNETNLHLVNAELEQLVTARTTEAIEARQQSETLRDVFLERFRALIESIKDYAIVMLDPDGRVITWNPGAQQLIGYTEKEIIGQKVERFFPPEDIAVGMPGRLLAQAAEIGRCEVEGWRIRKDGTQFFAHVVLTAMRDPAGELVGFAKITRDITERKQVENALRASEAQLRRAQRLVQMGTDVINLRTGEWQWSDETYAIFGVSRETFVPTVRNVMALVHPDDRLHVRERRARRVAEDRCPEPIEYRIIRPDGGLRWLYRESELVDGKDEILTTTLDITDRRRTEEQLHRAQKMEAIGNLTGGVAHDFNNLLGVIVGNIDAVYDLRKDDPEVAELTQDALAAAFRGAELTRLLLAFARQQKLQPQRIDVNEMVSGVTRLLRRVLAQNIEIRLDLARELWPAMADPAQLETSLINLANNSRDAMPDGGELKIVTGNRHLDAADHDEVTPGDYVMIEVSDTGTGMSAQIAAQIFEPFFTTKERDKGTGLGLSMVFGFIKQSGGHISVSSEPGVGTTFRLWLPRMEKDNAMHDDDLALPAERGGETILVVEDNAPLRRIVVRQLSELGYHVLTAENGITALEVMQRESIDLLLTDVIMPGGIDGVELARRARQHGPELKVVFTSGFVEPIADCPRKTLPADAQLLAKPYRRDQLAALVRESLDA